MKFKDERSMQEYFCQKLRDSGWLVKDDSYDEENWSDNGTVRIDVLAHHKSFDEWFAFELKNPDGFKDITLALKQMCEKYKNQYWKNIGQATLTSLILPEKYIRLIRFHFVYERFFWRFGFGVGYCDTMKVRFNDTSKHTVDLMNPSRGCFSLNPKEHLAEILKLMEGR